MSRFIIIIFFIWKISLFIIAWFGEKILTFSPRFPYADILLIPSHLPSWLWSFANFDGVHYLTIAANGYTAQYTQVFFPLYPLLLGITQRIFPFLGPILNGLFISNIFFLLSLYMFAKLLALDYKKDIIKWILLFLLTFPTSFFFGSIYTESLFFFLVIASLYTARKRKWLLVGILGGLASATKLIGIFLLPALILEMIDKQNLRFKSIIYTLRSPLLLIPVGLLSYMLYLQVNFGDWLYFWHAQPVFGAERVGSSIVLLPQVIWRYLKIFTTLPITAESYWVSMEEFISTLGSLILLYIAYRKKVRPSYLLFSILAVITPTLTGTFSSMPRYILMAFPIFISLGMLKSKLFKIILIFVFTALLVLLTLFFTRGHWVG